MHFISSNVAKESYQVYLKIKSRLGRKMPKGKVANYRDKARNVGQDGQTAAHEPTPVFVNGLY